MTDKPKNSMRRSWVKALLIVSLGVNLAVATFVIGLALKGPPKRPAPQNQDAIAFLSYALPKEHRQEIRRELVNRRDEFRANRAALRGLRLEMIQALEQEPFEIEQVEDLLEQQRNFFLSMGELAHDALIRRIAELTPEERAVYIASLRRDSRPERQSN